MSRPTVFISYSHEDKSWKDQLVKHLEVLGLEMDFETWSDERIGVGENWHGEIEDAIDRAQIAVLLVSVDFLKSTFILETEVPRFLERRAHHGMRIYPVIVRACTWPRIGWLGSIQARLFSGKPLSALRGNNLETALASIAEEIWNALGHDPARLRSQQFLRTYRECLKPKWERWDLAPVGVTQTGGATAPIQTTLDDMYLPLRLGQGFDINVLSRGFPLTPDDILHQWRPFVIRGPAGAGKTTWMRWTFRRLLEKEDAFPVMLVLRDLARRWQAPGCIGPERSLDTFLDDCITELLGGRFQGELRKVLAERDGPQPLLLVDGWDETGRLGEELREKLLIFMRQYPRIRVVVTSRPYGESWPSHGEGFAVLDIQPLSDEEISTFSERFFDKCYGKDHETAKKEAERFRKSLERSPEPQALARTALLLTMMLLISRSRPLPDKRHLLYGACIENLLTALPQRKEEEGALLQQEQYRPPDSEERLRVVANLAFHLQEDGYTKKSRTSIVRGWKKMALLLPIDWTERQRLGFLAWLAGPAGLLTDRTDGTLAFAHLSFQEFLSAWYLNAEVEGAEARIEAFHKRLGNWAWWETLRLWAALIERQSPGKLDPVFEALSQQEEEGLSLAGTLLADGLSGEKGFDRWTDSFLSALSTGHFNFESCAQAWAASRQDVRKEDLVHRLATWAPAQKWLGWFCGQEFSDAALGYRLPLPEGLLARSIVADIQGGTESRDALVAAGRILSGGPSIWPIEPTPLGLLQLWPGQRRLLGLRLQLAAACGARTSDLVALAGTLLNSPQWDSKDDALARGFARSFVRKFTSWPLRYFARDLSRDLARYFLVYVTRESPSDFASYLARYFARCQDYLTKGLDPDSSREFARRFARDFALHFANDFDQDLDRYLTRGFARQVAHDFANSWGLTESAQWLESFACIELSSLGKASVRSVVAHTPLLEIPETSLLSQACQLSLHPDRDPFLLNRALEKYSSVVDPLWPALARHLARRSREEDRILLISLAQSPENRESPLSWGLQFIVRGDVMLDNGSCVTLDELADELGRPRLPYLEEIPDEIEVDW